MEGARESESERERENSLFQQHIVNTTVFPCMCRVEKGSSRRHRL